MSPTCPFPASQSSTEPSPASQYPFLPLRSIPPIHYTRKELQTHHLEAGRIDCFAEWTRKKWRWIQQNLQHRQSAPGGGTPRRSFAENSWQSSKRRFLVGRSFAFVAQTGFVAPLSISATYSINSNPLPDGNSPFTRPYWITLGNVKLANNSSPLVNKSLAIHRGRAMSKRYQSK